MRKLLDALLVILLVAGVIAACAFMLTYIVPAIEQTCVEDGAMEFVYRSKGFCFGVE